MLCTSHMLSQSQSSRPHLHQASAVMDRFAYEATKYPYVYPFWFFVIQLPLPQHKDAGLQSSGTTLAPGIRQEASVVVEDLVRVLKDRVDDLGLEA